MAVFESEASGSYNFTDSADECRLFLGTVEYQGGLAAKRVNFDRIEPSEGEGEGEGPPKGGCSNSVEGGDLPALPGS